MNNTVRIGLGVGLLVIAILAVFAIKFFGGDTGSVLSRQPSCAPITIRGYFGGEKSSFLKDADVIRILKDRYCIALDARKAGSIEMVRDTILTPQDDFLWPSNQVALALYKQRNGLMVTSSNIFNSPLVIYTWTELTKALEKQGIVTERGGSYYISDFKKLADLIKSVATWSSIGMNGMNGKVAIRTTDPNVSNSGAMFAALLAGAINNGEVPDDGTIENILPELANFFARLGFMEQSSEDLFQQYLTTGIGAKPMVAGYESQLVEYWLQNPNDRQNLKDNRRILYPDPTVWSSHPLIARTANGKRLLEALKDPEIQEIAWKAHGFRSGLAGIKSDPAVLQGMSGVALDITSVMDTPAPHIFDRILNKLAGR